MIYAAGTGAQEFDRADIAAHAAGDPDGHDHWTVANSHRLDVPVDTGARPVRAAARRSSSCRTTSCRCQKWNGNPYDLDGGNGGRTEDDGAYFLLPYWMGRYHGLLGE